MENSLKQRIIGAIVLIALAIIFLPAILKEKISNGEFESKIPDMPPILEEYQVDTVVINKLANKPPTEIEQQLLQKESQIARDDAAEQILLENSIKMANPSNKKADKLPPQNGIKQDKVKLAQQSISPVYQDAAWVVQVASFRQSSNAKNLIEKLKKQGFKAYRRSVSVKGKQLYRVYVGPFVEKPDAKKTLTKIAKISQTMAIVKAFDPIYH
ncbi:MAG: SPOR domain-containing protein [Enterobacterales bacterium]|nr:SPOR domain-containing protein [Enterobacterales bacterium]